MAVHFTMRKEDVKSLSIGLYRRIGDYIAAAKRDDPATYERFLTEYQATATQAKKRRATRKRPSNTV
jgi:hypothetical protein